MHARVYAYVYAALLENTAGKRTAKEISLFHAELAKMLSSFDYDTLLKLKKMQVVGFTMKSTCILLKNVSSWHVVVLTCPRN